MKFKLLITFVIAILLLAACTKKESEKLDLPATFAYKNIANETPIKVYSSTGEITSGDLSTWTGNGAFVQLGDDSPDHIIIEDETTIKFEFTDYPEDNVSGTYTESDDLYTITILVQGGLQAIMTAELDGNQFNIHGSAYAVGSDGLDETASGVKIQTLEQLQAQMGATDTLAFQEYDFVYEKE